MPQDSWADGRLLVVQNKFTVDVMFGSSTEPSEKNILPLAGRKVGSERLRIGARAQIDPDGAGPGQENFDRRARAPGLRVHAGRQGDPVHGNREGRAETPVHHRRDESGSSRHLGYRLARRLGRISRRKGDCPEGHGGRTEALPGRRRPIAGRRGIGSERSPTGLERGWTIPVGDPRRRPSAQRAIRVGDRAKGALENSRRSILPRNQLLDRPRQYPGRSVSSRPASRPRPAPSQRNRLRSRQFSEARRRRRAARAPA